MVCEEEALLLWHAGEALGEAESRAVEQHLLSCARCQNRLAETKRLARLVRSTPAPAETHPSAEELARIAEGDEIGLAVARSHVAACSECREIVSVVERVNRDLQEPAWLPGAPGAVVGRLAAAGKAFGELLRPWVLSPVPAYLLALVLLYPAYLGLMGSSELRERLQALDSPQLLDVPLSLDTESERGSGVGSLRVERRGSRAVLTFLVPIASERYRYQIELLRGERRLFFETDARSFDGQGTFALLIPQQTLSEGDYQVRVEELEKTSGARANLFSFPFRVEN